MTKTLKEQHARSNSASTLLEPILGTSLIFLASMFVAILFTETMRQQAWTKELPALYWLFLPISAALGILPIWLLAKEKKLWKFYGFIVAGLISVSMSFFLMTPSLMQILWFVGINLFLGALVFLVPGMLLQGNPTSLIRRISKVQKSSYLVRLWTRYSVQSRYSQNVLGISWVMLYPLLEAVVIGFAFSVLMNRGEVAGKPFIVFLLSGIVLFNLFSRTVIQSTISLVGAMGVIKQIYFPREIIVLVLIGEELINFFFSFLTLLLINILTGTYPNIQYLILFLPTLIMAGIALGTSLFASFANLVFRDIQQLTVLLTRLLFYVTVLFSLRVASPKTAIFGLANPLTAVIEFFRSITLYEQQPDFVVLVWPAVVALALIYSGYIFFIHNEGIFVDFA